MKERPILFSGEMVRAILEGRKTMTRRVVKPPFEIHPNGYITRRQGNERLCPYICPYGQPGDRLWVRETFNWSGDNELLPGEPHKKCPERTGYTSDNVVWAVDGYDEHPQYGKALWLPSTHMPRWASRITLEIVSIRVERIQDITKGTQAEVIHRIEAEGVTCKSYTGAPYCTNCSGHEAPCHIEKFQRTWNSINAKRGYGWDANPWVWAIEFTPAPAPEGGK